MPLDATDPSPVSSPLAPPKKEEVAFLAPPEQPGELGRLGGYRILGLLGKGAMGIVFEAEDISLRRKVALKVILPQVADKPHARTRFLREARTRPPSSTIISSRSSRSEKIATPLSSPCRSSRGSLSAAG